MTNLIIGTSAIREIDGLYSLNDLHRASGGEPNHKPAFFLRNKQVADLQLEIDKAGITALRTTHGGSNSGTYACRELVIAYAAWISAAFHLKVIRVFLGTQTPNMDCDYRAEVLRDVTLYVHEMNAEIKRSGGTIPKWPDMSPDKIAEARIAEIISCNRFIAYFNHEMRLVLSEIPSNARIASPNITKDVDAFIDAVPLVLLPKVLEQITARLNQYLKTQKYLSKMGKL